MGGSWAVAAVAARGSAIATWAVRQHLSSIEAPARPCAPVATPRQHRLAGRGLLHGEVRAQYSISGCRLPTLMRHDLLLLAPALVLVLILVPGLALALAIDLGPSGVGEAPRAAVLVALPGRTRGLQARLPAALAAAIALPSLARAAHPHLHAAARARQQPRAVGLGRRLHSGHRPLRLEPASARRCRRPGSLDTTGQPLPYSARTRGNHGGARRHQQLAGHCGCRARSITARRSTAPRQHCQAGLRPASPAPLGGRLGAPGQRARLA